MSKRKINLKSETYMINFCPVFDDKGELKGTGYTLVRQSGQVVPVLSSINEDKELEPGFYSVRHNDDERLVVVCWIMQ